MKGPALLIALLFGGIVASRALAITPAPSTRELSPTNLAPTVQFAFPTNGQALSETGVVMLAVTVHDPDGLAMHASVEFYFGTSLLGAGSLHDPGPLHDAVYFFQWTNVPPGSYTLRAKATDEQGATGVSDPIQITVGEWPVLPLVRIEATSPIAEETSDPLGRLRLVGVFTLSRTGPTSTPLSAFVFYSGTATPGVDCNPLPGFVTIPAGAVSTTIRVEATPDGVPEGIETLVAQVSPCPPPPSLAPCFAFNVDPLHQRATVFIRDNGLMRASVAITSPADGAHFLNGDGIPVQATAVDLDGFIDRVEFWDGDTLVGESQVNFIRAPDPGTPVVHRFEWLGAVPGLHTLTARALSTLGVSITSAPVHVEVLDSLPLRPVVTIKVTDAYATEPGVTAGTDPGVFTVTRSGATNDDLPVFFTIGGTASNGVDYTAISNSVTIPAGRTDTRIIINPLLDYVAEPTETVELQLQEPICPAIFPPPPGCYRVGTPGEATVFIQDNHLVTNHPPSVSLVTPTNGQVFTPPANIFLLARAQDADGYDTIATVEFLADDTSLGIRTNVPTLNPIGPFFLTWADPPPGDHTLIAKVTDANGAVGISAPIHVTVQNDSSVPVVTIVARDPVASEGTNCWHWVGWLNHAPTNLPGTNTAMFLVHRAGPTNGDLTVYYHVGGTASNGVDYVAITDSVLIPAGNRAASITIVPYDDSLAEGIETVVIELRPAPVSSNTPVPYLIGFPRRAAAIIVDDDQPRPLTGELADHCFHFESPATNGTWFRIEASTDMLHWTPLCTNVVTDGALHFIDPDAMVMPTRFYRAVIETNPPAE